MGRRLRGTFVALIALALALQTLLFSVLVVELEHHDCEGEHCVSCQLVSTARAVLSGRGAAAAGSARPVLVQGYALAGAVLLLAAVLSAETPVTRRDLLVI